MPTLRHIVCLKFADGVDKKKVAEAIKAGLATLPSKVAPALGSVVFVIACQRECVAARRYRS